MGSRSIAGRLEVAVKYIEIGLIVLVSCSLASCSNLPEVKMHRAFLSQRICSKVSCVHTTIEGMVGTIMLSDASGQSLIEKEKVEVVCERRRTKKFETLNHRRQDIMLQRIGLAHTFNADELDRSCHMKLFVENGEMTEIFDYGNLRMGKDFK